MDDILGLDDPLGLNDPLGLDSPSNKGPMDNTKQYQAYVQRRKQEMSRASIPGAEAYDKRPIMSQEEYTKQIDEDVKNSYLGAGEAALSFITGIPATLAGSLAGITAPINPMAHTRDPQKMFEDISQALTYAPRTTEGQQYAQKIGHAMQALPPVGGYVNTVRPKASKPVNIPIEERLKPVVPEAPSLPVEQFPTGDLRLESPVAADIRVQQQNRRLNTADDFNNRDANVRAVEEEIAAFEAAQRHDQMMADEAAYQERMARDKAWREGPEAQLTIHEDYGSNDPLARMPEMRVDENNIPIRADLSMEAQNLQNPLQRNLWGDELPMQTGDGGIPLTQALDSMPPGPARDSAMNQLRGQRGAIDAAVFEDAINKLKNFVSEDIIAQLRAGPDWKSRNRLILMPVDEFLSQAKEGHNEMKQAGVNDWFGKKPMHSEPQLWYQQGDGTQASVVGHEGRHRARAMKAAGLEYIPVRINSDRIRWTEQNNPNNFDYRNDYPTSLKTEQNTLTNFPIPREEATLPNAGKFKQRGGVDVKAIEEGVNKLKNNLQKVGSKLVDPKSPEEKLITKNIGDTSFIPKGESPETALPKILAESDGPKLANSLQSGLGSAAEKSRSALQRFTNHWLAWAEKSANKMFRDFVQPMEKTFGELKPNELNDLVGTLKLEMFDRQRYTPEQLKAAGLTDKAMKAYTQLRDAYSDALNRINESRAKLGLKEITPMDAYFSSQWRGNWHMPVKDANGKLVWYVKTNSKSEANKAAAWFKKNHPEYKYDAPSYKGDGTYGVPKDVTDSYTQMLELFKDTPLADEISAIMEQYKTQRDVSAGNFKVHFENKANIRGFIGDRPWLTEKQNAHQAAKAQIEYLKDAYRWAPLQEAYGNIKQVFSNPDVVSKQPNNLALAKLYTANAMGVTDNMFRVFENRVAKVGGISPGTMREFVGSLKTLTYLTQLGLSTGYMVATPLQAFVLGPALHMKMSGEGFKYNPMTAMAKSIQDTAQIILAHHSNELLGGNVRYNKLSPLAQEAMRYAEDNGIISVQLFDEYSNLGEHKAVTTAKDVIGFTISYFEKIARTSTFMSFVHHLDQSGQFKNDKPVMFRRAEELTDLTLTKFSRSGRPLLVDQLGLTGELAYTYKSPIFNHYNTLNILARDAKRTGNWKPLLAAMAMTGVMGGMLGMPGVQELDSLLDMFKDGVAQVAPQHTKDLEKVSIKNFMYENLPDWATYGALSAATNTQLASRFSTQIMDPSRPLEDVSPAFGVVNDVVGNAVNMAANRNSTSVLQAANDLLPPIPRGLAETSFDRHKAGPQGEDGRTPYYNAARLEENKLSYRRTEDDEFKRRLGLTSLEEARTKDVRYADSKETKRYDTARQRSMSKLYDAIKRGDKEDVQTYAKAYINNKGDDSTFERDFQKKIESANLTPEELSIVKADTLREIEALLRHKRKTQ